MLDMSAISWQFPLFWIYLRYAGSVNHHLAASFILNLPSDMLDLSVISWQLPLFWIYLLICRICQSSLGSFLYSDLTLWYAGSVSYLMAAFSILNLPSDMLDLSVISWQLPLFWSYLVICWICQLSHGSFLYSELTFWYAGSVSHLLAASSIAPLIFQLSRYSPFPHFLWKMCIQSAIKT
jgi:hypothetical protein